MSALDHRMLNISGYAGGISLTELARLADMQPVDVAHTCWPLGLLIDADGDAWRIGPVSSPAIVTVIRADPADLHAELQRLLGPWVTVHDEPPDDMPGLNVPRVRYVSLPSIRAPVILDVAKSVAALAVLHHAVSIENDTGRVLRVLERSGALLRSGA